MMRSTFSSSSSSSPVSTPIHVMAILLILSVFLGAAEAITEWRPTAWSACSGALDSQGSCGGTHSRSLECFVNGVRQGTPTACNALPKPPTVEPCPNACPFDVEYEWRIVFAACDTANKNPNGVKCGTGSEVASVQCWSKLSTEEGEEDGTPTQQTDLTLCDATIKPTKPGDRSCTMSTAKCGLWNFLGDPAGGACMFDKNPDGTNCGPQYKPRVNKCIIKNTNTGAGQPANKESTTVNDCVAGDEPTRKPTTGCLLPAAPHCAQLYVTEWDECDVDCGFGEQSRTVECRSLSDNHALPSDETCLDADNTKWPANILDDIRRCDMGPCCDWDYTDYGECDAPCHIDDDDVILHHRSPLCLDEDDSPIELGCCYRSAESGRISDLDDLSEECETDACELNQWLAALDSPFSELDVVFVNPADPAASADPNNPLRSVFTLQINPEHPDIARGSELVVTFRVTNGLFHDTNSVEQSFTVNSEVFLHEFYVIPTGAHGEMLTIDYELSGSAAESFEADPVSGPLEYTIVHRGVVEVDVPDVIAYGDPIPGQVVLDLQPFTFLALTAYYSIPPFASDSETVGFEDSSPLDDSFELDAALGPWVPEIEVQLRCSGAPWDELNYACPLGKIVRVLAPPGHFPLRAEFSPRDNLMPGDEIAITVFAPDGIYRTFSDDETFVTVVVQLYNGYAYVNNVDEESELSLTLTPNQPIQEIKFTIPMEWRGPIYFNVLISSSMDLLDVGQFYYTDYDHEPLWIVTPVDVECTTCIYPDDGHNPYVILGQPIILRITPETLPQIPDFPPNPVDDSPWEDITMTVHLEAPNYKVYHPNVYTLANLEWDIDAFEYDQTYDLERFVTYKPTGVKNNLHFFFDFDEDIYSDNSGDLRFFQDVPDLYIDVRPGKPVFMTDVPVEIDTSSTTKVVVRPSIPPTREVIIKIHVSHGRTSAPKNELRFAPHSALPAAFYLIAPSTPGMITLSYELFGEGAAEFETIYEDDVKVNAYLIFGGDIEADGSTGLAHREYPFKFSIHPSWPTDDVVLNIFYRSPEVESFEGQFISRSFDDETGAIDLEIDIPTQLRGQYFEVDIWIYGPDAHFFRRPEVIRVQLTNVGHPAIVIPEGYDAEWNQDPPEPDHDPDWHEMLP